MRTAEYKSLVNSYSDYNSWRSEDSFPIKNANQNVLEALKEYHISEYIFKGMQSERTQDKFEALISEFKEGVINILKKDKRKKYLFAIENNSSLKSRIRTYKGFIKKKQFKEHEYVEKELHVTSKESRIAFVAELSESNIPI